MAPESRTRTIPCVQCRGKHIKCDGEVPCASCRQSSLRCIRPERFSCRRFVASQESSLFDPDQEWLPTRRKRRKKGLSIIDETKTASKYFENDSLPFHEEVTERTIHVEEDQANDETQDDGDSQPIEDQPIVYDVGDPEPFSAHVEPEDITHSPISSTSHHLQSPEISFPDPSQITTPQSFDHRWQHLSPGSTSVVSQNPSHPTPASSTHAHGALSWHDSPVLTTSCSPQQLGPGGRLDLNQEEACLLKYFVQVIARAFDVTDRDHHYVTVLPIRAIRSPLLLNAICTASARYLTQLWSLKNPNSTIEYDGVPLPDLTSESAIHYHNKCISYLMGISVDPQHSCSDDALIAITILRFHEQMDSSLTGADNETFSVAVYAVFEASQDEENGFLNGGTKQPPRGINPYAPAMASLRFSACMIALRQEIYSVLVHSRPFRLPLLASYDYPNVDELDEYDWTNRIIVWCGRVLHFCCCREENQGQGLDAKSRVKQWEELKSFLASWDREQPPHFAPIYDQEPRPEEGKVFPTIWLASRCQIMALQHIELARIVLAVHDPKRKKIGIGVSAAQQSLEELLRKSTNFVCGLAMSDQNCQEGMVTAAVAISMCGEYFNKPDEQAAIVDLMVSLERKHAWPTRKLLKELRKAWAS